jgi:hypothetical protein
MWKRIKDYHPPKNMVLMTKIEDEDGTRNEQKLILDGNLWFLPDKSTYVYYTPTHWKCID